MPKRQTATMSYSTEIRAFLCPMVALRRVPPHNAADGMACDRQAYPLSPARPRHRSLELVGVDPVSPRPARRGWHPGGACQALAPLDILIPATNRGATDTGAAPPRSGRRRRAGLTLDEDSVMNGGPPLGRNLDVWRERAPGFNLDRVTAPLRLEALGLGSVLAEWEPIRGPAPAGQTSRALRDPGRGPPARETFGTPRVLPGQRRLVPVLARRRGRPRSRQDRPVRPLARAQEAPDERRGVRYRRRGAPLGVHAGRAGGHIGGLLVAASTTDRPTGHSARRSGAP